MTAFLKGCEDKLDIYESNYVFVHSLHTDFQKANKITVDIFGSCVTRDFLFYNRRNQPQIIVAKYISRSSMISCISKPVKIPEYISLDNTWKVQNVKADFEKTIWKSFSKSESDVLLIDLIDERFKLAKKNDSYVTISSDAVKIGALSQDDEGLVDYYEENGELKIDGRSVADLVIHFINKLTSCTHYKKIILHETYLSDFYLNKNSEVRKFDNNIVSLNATINNRLELLYSLFKRYVPNIDVISCSDYRIAAEDNKWGLAPMHYIPEYYDSIWNTFLAVSIDQ